MNSKIKMEKSEARIYLLYLYKNLLKICEKSGVKCFAYQGTLLGAVKYGGFIPWDDDMDFVIFREDYDNFVAACKENLNKYVVLRTRETDPYFCEEYIKLCFEDDEFGYSDVSLDVFIFDNTNPNRKLLRIYQDFMLRNLYLIKRYKISKYVPSRQYKPKSFIKRTLLSIASSIPFVIIEKMHKAIMTMDKRPSQFCVNWGSHYNRDLETYEKSEWKDSVLLDFENIKIIAPVNFDKLLKQLYGEKYMEPYPVEKQVDHGVRNLNSTTINADVIRKLI